MIKKIQNIRSGVGCRDTRTSSLSGLSPPPLSSRPSSNSSSGIPSELWVHLNGCIGAHWNIKQKFLTVLTTPSKTFCFKSEIFSFKVLKNHEIINCFRKKFSSRNSYFFSKILVEKMFSTGRMQFCQPCRNFFA